ncbi:MAG: Rho termination factor N-terminal domain-containing protein [Candidatus Izemoplasmatales bacterium]
MADAVIEANGGVILADAEEEVEEDDEVEEIEEEVKPAPVKKVVEPKPAPQKKVEVKVEPKKEVAKPAPKAEPVVKVEPKKEEVKVAPAAPAVDYEAKTVAELKEIAKELGLTGISALKKADLIEKIKEVK